MYIRIHTHIYMNNVCMYDICIYTCIYRIKIHLIGKILLILEDFRLCLTSIRPHFHGYPISYGVPLSCLEKRERENTN